MRLRGSTYVHLLAAVLAITFCSPILQADAREKAAAGKRAKGKRAKGKRAKGKRAKGKRRPGRKARPSKDHALPRTDLEIKVDALIASGLKLAADKSPIQALAEFEEALALEPRPRLLFHIASVCEQLGDYPKALLRYEEFLASAETDAELLGQGRTKREKLLALPGKLQVSTNPEGAALSVDGQSVGTTPLADPLLLQHGPHELRATLSGYQTKVSTIDIKRGGSRSLTLNMVEPRSQTAESAAATSDTHLSLTSSSDASSSSGAFLLRSGFGTNVRNQELSGAPSVGVGYAFDRLSLVVDAVLVAYALLPQIRYRIVGQGLSVHLIAAAPVSYDADADDTIFPAAAGGLSLQVQPGSWLSLHIDAMASYAGATHGLTLPVFAGGALRF